MKRIIAILMIVISMFIWFHCRCFSWLNITAVPEFGPAIVWSWNICESRTFISTSQTFIERTFKLATIQKKRQQCYVCYVFIIQSPLIKIVYKKLIDMDWLILYSFQEAKNIWLPVFLRKPNMIFVVVTTYWGELTSSKIQVL